MSEFCLSVINIPKTKTLRAVILLAIALSAGSLFAEGQVFWQEGGVSVRDSTVGVVAGMVPDGSGGAIVVWIDNREVPISDAIYAQRIDSSGARIWPDSGVAACQPFEGAYWLEVAPDGADGAVLYWQEGDLRLRAQRLDCGGARPWGDSSVAVFDTAGVELRLLDLGMCSDGRGGCIVFWSLYYHYPDSIVLRAQHVDSLGQLAWGPRGRRIARDLAVYGAVGVVALGSEGYVLTWIRDDGEICAQRIDTAGNEVWTVSVCSGVSVFGFPTIVRTDGGVLVCWTDMRNGDWDVYAQKLNPAGNPLWAQNGVPVCRAAGQQGGWVHFLGDMVQVAGRPDGGALVAFYDRSRGTTAISCQRLSAAGEMVWDSAGVEAGRVMDRDTLFSSTAFGLVPDTAGGAIVTWPKYLPGDSSQVWAQHLTAAGAAAWDTGECISECAGYYDLPAFLTTDDGKNGAIGCWGDFRFGGPHGSIYAQRYGDGPLGMAESRGNLSPRVQLKCPNPLSTGATISLLPLREQSASLVLFDACGRKVCHLWEGSAALPCAVRWPGTDDSGRRLQAGVYVLRLVVDGRLVASKLVTVVR
jgi:hypothetical protein